MKLKTFKAPLLIIAVGAAMVALSFLILNWYKWEPASFQLDLRPGVSQSPKFRVNLTTNYQINLHVERNIPYEQINCLLGIERDFPDRCRNITSSVEMKWFVFSDGNLIAEGNSNQVYDGGWGPTILRTIGRFKGQKGKEYIVKVESLQDLSVLAPTKPQFKIEVHPIEFKGNFLLATLVSWSGLAIGAVGCLYLLIRLFIEFYRQRKT